MFDSRLPEIGELGALDDAALVDAVRASARVENAACARKLAVMAELFSRRTGLEAGDDRESWWVDPCYAVGAELGAAQGITAGLALSQTHRGVALRDRLPKVAALFEAGDISDLLVRTIVWRTYLITDPDAMALVDAVLAEQVTTWKPLSARKTEQAIDVLVERYDPGALRRAQTRVRSRDVEFGSLSDEPGFTSMWARLYAADATALEQRIEAMARGVCADDPRDITERRADALTALAAGHKELACECGDAACSAADRERTQAPVIVHVVADQSAVGATPEDASAQPQCPAPPAFVLGGGVLPAPLLTSLIDRATVREVRHPGDAPAEDRYTPSRALAEFVRCRDLTCRFPGCDRAATLCDLDHTLPYPLGPTHGSNLKCLCRFHHLLKTFWGGVRGWRDRQLPDGTVIWTSPTGHTYLTRPGSRLLFPSLCRPTATLSLSEAPAIVSSVERGAMMPKRRRTRRQDLCRRIEAERRLNDALVAERNSPRPF